jgi:ribosomal protein S6--L-glutamate ligase
VKLAILSTAPKCYSTRRFKQAAEARGHKVKILNTLRFSIDLEHGEPSLFYRGKELSDYDAVLPRIGASITYFGTAVVRQFEQLDVYTPNTANGILNSRDKLRSLQILSRHDIGIPHSCYMRNQLDVLPAIERIGGAPVIIKLIEGTQGVGVILAESNKVAEGIIETLQSAKQNVLVQKFVAESKGRDVRALVVGDRVVAAMRRVAQIMGLRVAGVDLLESHEGPQVMEVNSSPGMEGIEGCTGLDIAGSIIDYIANQVDFPEIDIRQRLTVSVGYGVAEIYIPEGSDFVGKTIEASGLRERDLTVLTVNRGTAVFSNPKGSRILEGGDRLLCYGKLETMRDLVPERTKRRKKPRIGKLDQSMVEALEISK